MKPTQQTQQGVVVRIDDDLYQWLSKQRGPGQSFNDVLRRRFGLEPKRKWRRR